MLFATTLLVVYRSNLHLSYKFPRSVWLSFSHSRGSRFSPQTIALLLRVPPPQQQQTQGREREKRALSFPRCSIQNIECVCVCLSVCLSVCARVSPMANCRERKRGGEERAREKAPSRSLPGPSHWRCLVCLRARMRPFWAGDGEQDSVGFQLLSRVRGGGTLVCPALSADSGFSMRGAVASGLGNVKFRPQRAG